MTDAHTRFVDAADGRRICFADWGPPDGYPVLELHGSPGCRLSVPPDRLAVAHDLGVRLITYDRPGYGRSDRDIGYQVIDRVEDVSAIAGSAGLDEFAVTGGSAGSPYALAAAARLPGRVSRVLVHGALAPIDGLGVVEWQRLNDPDSVAFSATVRSGIEKATALIESLDAQIRSSTKPDDPMRPAIEEQTRQGVGGWVDDEIALETPWGFDVAAVSVPTVIWSHPDDTVSPPNHAEWLAARIAGSTLVSSHNALGHADLEDEPRAWRAAFTFLVTGNTIDP